MKNTLWKILAWVVSRKPVADYLIGRATRTPYVHLNGYMNRYWLFNRYSEVGHWEYVPLRFPRMPSIRIHHILRADIADHPHDHPWDARTIILRNGYREKRGVIHGSVAHLDGTVKRIETYDRFERKPGDTAPVLYGEYHHIEEVHPLGAWTMFITWGYKDTWGFLVDGEKVPWREYEKLHPGRT